jgi:hypothetical protein
LKKKSKLREKYHVLDEWVMPFEVIPIIDIPEYGSMAAAKACEDLKIQSQNDAVKLAEAKAAVYLKVTCFLLIDIHLSLGLLYSFCNLLHRVSMKVS